MRYCPWCGTELPPSMRERWYAEVARLGLDPDAPDFPVEYRSDAWWRRPSA